MSTRIYILAILLFGLPLWSQVEPGAVGGVINPDDNERMMVPPPVSGQGYPTLTGGELRSNFLRTGVTFNTAYNDNLLAGETPTPIGDTIYTIFPSIILDQKTPRQHRVLNYSPGFMFFQNTSQLDEITQAANVEWEFRLSPRAIMSVSDGFAQNSNAFSQPSMFQGGLAAAPTPAPNAVVIYPFVSQMTNNASVELTYQFGLNGMVGGSGTTGFFKYPNISQAAGLFNSNENSGTAFYSRRLTSRQYLGVIDEYSNITTSPIATTTNTNAVLAFYTLYWGKQFNASVLVGPQYFQSSGGGVSEPGSWEPAVMASFNWIGRHTNLAGSYSRVVGGGGGLLGAYATDTAALSGRWVMAKTWNAGIAANYYVLKNVTPQLVGTIPGGRTLTVNFLVHHTLTEHLAFEASYQRLHEKYAGIGFLVTSPDSNQEAVSLQYQFNRPLGR